MRLKTDFWTPIDWKDESGISKHFIVGAVATSVVAILTLLYASSSIENNALKAKKQGLEEIIERTATVVEPLREARDGIKELQVTFIKPLENIALVRVPRSNEIEEFGNFVPNNISITSVEIVGGYKVVNRKPEEIMSFSLKIDGTTRGESVESRTANIKSFYRQLSKAKTSFSSTTKYEITNSTSVSSDNISSFVIRSK